MQLLKHHTVTVHTALGCHAGGDMQHTLTVMTTDAAIEASHCDC